MPKKTYTADDIRDRLRAKFNTTGVGNGFKCVTLEEVANGTGARCGSWVDMAVFELWPSRGLIRRAIEIKVSRSDFLRELANKDKNHWARQAFHEFWFAAPSDVVKETELPEGVGLYVPHGDSMAVKRAAAMRHDPVLNDHLLASFMRSAYTAIHNDQQEAIKRAFKADPDHQRGQMALRVIGRFLKEHGGSAFFYSKSEDELLSMLRECTVEKETKMRADKVFSALGRFREAMQKLFPHFAALAFQSLKECDDLSKLVFSYWGVQDDGAWSHLIAEARKSGNGKKAKGLAKQISNFAKVSGLPFDRMDDQAEREEA
jgi:hypothetical protein